MQTQQALTGPRYLVLSPLAAAVALALLAFLKGLFAWPLLVIAVAHMKAGWRSMPGGEPSGPGGEPGPEGGYYPHHMFGHVIWDMPWLFPAIWLASIAGAAIAGAIFAVTYNWIVGKISRSQAAAA